MRLKLYTILLLLTGLPFAGKAQTSISTSAVTETFTGFVGTAVTLPANWTTSGSGANGNSFQGTNQAAGASGGWYGNGNMSYLGSGSASNGTATWTLRNTGTGTITSFDFQFLARMYKNGTASPAVTYAYNISATSTPGTFTSMGSFNDATASISTGTTLTATVSSISIPANSYLFIRFVHAGGSNSDNLSWDDVKITPTVTAACTGPTVAATSYATTNLATTSATLGWTNGDGTNRVVFLKAGSITATPSNNTTYTASSDFTSVTSTAFDGGKTVYNSSGNSAGVTNLTPNTLYNAKVFEYLGAAGAECYYSTALPGSFTTLPNAATATAATVLTSSGFTANWTAPSPAGSATFTYTLEVATDTGFTNIVSTTNNIASSNTSQAVVGLSAFSTYYYRVRAVNGGGSSAASNRITVTTYAAAPPTPTSAANPACASTTLNAYTGGNSANYYWQGTNAAGTSTASPATSTYPVTATGTYYVRAYDNINAVWSAASSLLVTVYNAPTVTTQPSPANVGAGSTATFSVTATDAGSYQWQADTTGGGFVNLSNGGNYSGATSATLSIANTTLAMSGYLYRVIVGASSPCTGSVTSSPADTLTVTRSSVATDYFRSRATGAYSSTTTWESSADSLTWGNANLAPTNAARSVTIRSTDSVAVTAAGTAAHLYVYGKLVMTSTNALTVADSSGYDVVLFSSSVLTGGTSAAGFITLGSGATALAKTGSRIYNTVMSGAGASTSWFWETNATLEYAGTNAFSASGTTYFPTASAGTAPVLLISAAIGSSVGGSSATNINGVFQVGPNGSITWNQTGRKNFRDGLVVNGALSASANVPLVITGTNATLSGSGMIATGSGGGLSIASGATVTLSSNLTVNGDSLKVNGTLNTNGYILSGSTKFTVVAGSALNVTDAAGVTASATSGNIQTTGTRTYSKTATYTYQGSAAQVTGDGLPDTVGTLILSNAAGLTLSKATTITSALLLGTGNILTTSSNLLTLGASASLSGASSASYIDGPLRRYTAAGAAFAFPVGKNNVYAPAAVTPVDATPSNYTAEHFNGTQTTPGRTDKDTPTLRFVSANAYYDISRGAGANASVTLSYNEANKVNDVSTLVIAHYTGGRWVSEGGGANGGSTTTSGTVTSNVVSTFSPFAIGSGAPNQPLPVRLLSFLLQKKEGAAHLSWELGTTDGGEVIVVERSADGKVFAEINRKEVAQNAVLHQSFTDYAPIAGANYYRLRIVGMNGEETFSQTLLARFDGTAVEGLKVYPNPAREVLTLEWTNAEVPAQISLHNSAGQLVWTTRVTDGNMLSVPVEKLVPGVYWLMLEQAGKVERRKVVMGQ